MSNTKGGIYVILTCEIIFLALLLIILVNKLVITKRLLLSRNKILSEKRSNVRNTSIENMQVILDTTVHYVHFHIQGI